MDLVVNFIYWLMNSSMLCITTLGITTWKKTGGKCWIKTQKKNPIIIKIHLLTLYSNIFTLSLNLTIHLLNGIKYSININIYIFYLVYLLVIYYRITINNVHLPEADRLHTVVNSLRSAFLMINNNHEPPFIECSLGCHTLTSSQNQMHIAFLA